MKNSSNHSSSSASSAFSSSNQKSPPSSHDHTNSTPEQRSKPKDSGDDGSQHMHFKSSAYDFSSFADVSATSSSAIQAQTEIVNVQRGNLKAEGDFNVVGWPLDKKSMSVPYSLSLMQGSEMAANGVS
jgi:hypothetical protein